MKTMRWHPPGYGGERRDPDRVKRDGWRDQGVLAVSIDDERLSWPERELVRQLGDKLYGRSAPRARRAGAVTGFPVDPGIRAGVQPGSRACPGSFWFLPGADPYAGGRSARFASVRADFLGSHPGSRSPAGMPNGQ